MKKEQIRNIANTSGIHTAEKKDSQEICFIPSKDYKSFINNNISAKIEKGYFVDVRGNILGEHKGIINYTVGQRKGLGITFGKPAYVIEIKNGSNEIVLGFETEVFKKTIYIRSANFIPFDFLAQPMNCFVKVRNTSKEVKAVINPKQGLLYKIEFLEPQFAPAPGQSAVLYNEDIVLGGGIIT